MKKDFKQYKVLMISVVIVVFLGLVCFMIINMFFKNGSIVKDVNKKNYSFQYNKSWNVVKLGDSDVILKHNNDGKIIIQLSDIINKYDYLTIDEIIDETLYSIEKQNSDYKLLYKDNVTLTKDKYRGYKLLFENKNNQLMVVLFKKDNKLIMVSYEANNNYFDILLDSVNSIIYSLDIKNEEFSLKNSLKVKTSKIKFLSNDKFDKIFNKQKSYEIAKNNYLVKYRIPSNFIQGEINSSYGYFNLEYDNGSIDIMVDVLNENIYEYIDENSKNGLYKNYDSYKDNKKYSNFKQNLEYIDRKNNSYIYKNSYNYKKDSTEYYENVELMYTLENNHMLRVSIKSKCLPITKKMIDMIKIDSFKNYSSYIKIEKNNNFLIGRLKRFSDYHKNKVDLITINVSDNYEEYDMNKNIYLDRYYRYGFNDKLNVYDYDVHYKLTTLSSDTVVNNINSMLGNLEYDDLKILTYSGDLTLNEKKFIVYDSSYTDISDIMFSKSDRKRYYVNKKVLFYNIPNGGCLYIEINGNGKEITDNVLNELVNFVYEQRDYK